MQEDVLHVGKSILIFMQVVNVAFMLKRGGNYIRASDVFHLENL